MNIHTRASWAVGLVVMALLAPRGPAREESPEELCSLMFPIDKSYGRISAQKGRAFRQQFEARGRVRLPRGASVSFRPTRSEPVVVSTLLCLADCEPEELDLDLRGAEISDEDMVHLAKLKAVTQLDLSGNPLGDEGLRFLSDMPNLRTLNLGQTRVTDKGLRHLRSLSSLTRLFLFQTQITDDGVSTIAEMKQLESLQCSSCPGITDESLRVLSRMPHLEWLTLMDASITNQGIAYLKDSKTLAGLTLRGTAIGDEAMRYIGGMPQLESLDVQYTGVTDLGVQHLTGCTALARVTLGSDITDGGLKHLAGMSKLRSLSLADSNISDEGLRHLGRLKNLEHLRLSNIDITGSGFAYLTELPALRYITISNSSVTDAAVPHLAKMKSIRQLQMEDTLLSPRGTRRLKASLSERSCRFYDRQKGRTLQFELPDQYGRTVRSSDYWGAPVLVMAGAAWCGGCQQNAEPLRRLAEDYAAQGLQVLICIAGDNEPAALEFQKHYRLPYVHLLDANRDFEKAYNTDGWSFFMLADARGRIVYRTNESSLAFVELPQLISDALEDSHIPKTLIRDGTRYMLDTLQRSDEVERARRSDRFPSLACDSKGRVFVTFAGNRNGDGDIFLRYYDGRVWSDDVPVADSSGDEFDPSILVDSQDRLWISWTGYTQDNRYEIFVSAWAHPDESSRPVRITQSDDDSMHARLACDAQGRIWVSYYRWHRLGDYSRDKEVYARYLDGRQWSKEIRISPTDVSEYEDHADPILAGYADSAVVCWSWDFHRPQGYSSIPRDPSIFLSTVDASSGPARATAVSADTIDTHPAIVVGADNRIWSAWESIQWDRDNGANQKAVHCRILDLDTGAQPERGVNISGICENVCTPCLAVSKRGDVALVWSQLDLDLKWKLKCITFNAAGIPNGDARIVCSDENPRFPAVAYGSANDLWIAYTVHQKDGYRIKVTRLEEP